ncbi:MAG: Eco57I restriction-modification methylase domain-containing protein, partial [Candidatus Heimdallarchaeaceae archaeon]
MSSGENSLEIIKKLRKKHEILRDDAHFWMFLFSCLTHKTSNLDFFDRFLVKSPISDLINEVDHKKIQNIKCENKFFSLDETDTNRFLTPFHLSLLNYPKSTLKKTGQFYTPQYISDYIARTTLSLFFQETEKCSINDILIADIASGSGNLLLSFLNSLSKLVQSDFPRKPFDFHRFVSSNLFAFDIDPMALSICKLRILFFLDTISSSNQLPKLDENFQLGNSLLDYELSHSSDIDYFAQPINLINKRDSPLNFHLIISNPPYMCYGLRNAQNFRDEYKIFLRDRYLSSEYKLSLYPIFIERALELLKENGILGIITPDSFLLGRYYSKIRSYILKHSLIQEITMLGFEPFKTTTVGRPTLSFLKKQTNAYPVDPNLAFVASWFENLNDFLKQFYKTHTNFQSDFQETEHNRFFLFFSDKDRNIVKDWNKKSEIQLEDIATIHTGIRSKIGQKNIITDKKLGASWDRGIISSSQVKPFCVEYRNHWLNINPSNLWSGGYNKDIIKNPKIFIRQTGFNIVTAVDEDGYYHLNNVHSLSLKTDEINIYALSTILNSADFNDIYQILSNEKNRALAQVDIDFLSKISLPIFNQKKKKKLEEFYLKQSFICNQTKQS